MRRFALAVLFALAAGPASAAVCAGALPPPKLAAVDKPPAYWPQTVAVLRPGDPAARDFPYMRDLALQWRINHDKDALVRLPLYVYGWTAVYRPSFDPAAEAPLTGFIDAYAVAASDLPPEAQARGREFLHALAEGYLRRSYGAGGPLESRRIELATLAAWALGDDNLMARARAAFLRQIDTDILPNREVSEVARTGRLAEAVAVLGPLARAAVAAGDRGQDWLDLKSPRGHSLRAALAWLLPWAEGRRWHKEPGQSDNGGLWDPTTSAELFWAASLLDPRFLPLAQSLGPEAPHWIWAQAPCGGA